MIRVDIEERIERPVAIVVERLVDRPLGQRIADADRKRTLEWLKRSVESERG